MTYSPDLHTEQIGVQPSLTNIGVAAQTLSTFKPFEEGLLNLEDRRIIVKGNIAYSTGALETPAIQLSFQFDDGTDVLGVIFIESIAVAGGNNDSPIRFTFDIVTNTVGSSAAFIGTGNMFVTSSGVTTTRNMLPDWLSADQLDATKAITARLQIAASSNMASAHLVEAFLGVK